MRAQTATFPAHGLLPKEGKSIHHLVIYHLLLIFFIKYIETGASSFLLNNPDCDGRGTIVAILDTGVDPGAPGLQKTTVDGVHKMLDIIDCTGSGDVVMTEASPAVVGDGSTTTSAVIKSSASPGKLLRLPSSWKNPTGVYKIGQKSALDIFPKPLVDKLRRERKKEVGTT